MTRMAFVLVILTVWSCGSALAQHAAATNYHIGDQQRQERVDANGDIEGHYSYVDPNGQTVSVHYTAGKNGFQVKNNPVVAAPAAPTPPSTYIQPGTQYRGLQLQHSKYQKLLFSPAQNSLPAASAKQYEAYEKALREESEAQYDNLPAQFPTAAAQVFPAAYTTASSYNAPTVLSPFYNSQQQQATALYATRPSDRDSRPDLRTIAANPLPPQRRLVSQPRRIATPITEDGQEQQPGAIYNYRFNY